MEQKELLTVIVADDETELREAVCSTVSYTHLTLPTKRIV